MLQPCLYVVVVPQWKSVINHSKGHGLKTVARCFDIRLIMMLSLAWVGHGPNGTHFHCQCMHLSTRNNDTYGFKVIQRFKDPIRQAFSFTQTHYLNSLGRGIPGNNQSIFTKFEVLAWPRALIFDM